MILTKPGRRRGDRALTLVELLLSITLLLLLAGALVFSFSPLQSGRQVGEGLARLEALFGFARARAANTGSIVYLVVEAAEDESETGGSVAIQWEPDPVNQPGIFTNLILQPSFADAVNEFVSVSLHVEEETWMEDFESVLMTGGDDILGENLEEEAFEASEDDDEALALEDDGVQARFAFFPDGSSESAKLIVASRDGSDERRFLVELVGLTGSVRVEEVGLDGLPIEEEAFETDAFDSQFDDPLMTNSEPAGMLQ